MSSQRVDEFLLAAQRSGLIPAAEVEKLTRESFSDKFSTCEDLAAELVNRQLLSSYQAELLLSGRGDEVIVGGRYRILDKLGEGGMGAVYKAQDTRLDRVVAIKVLPPHYVQDPDAIARFEREARALAKLSHPNIVQAFDCGEDRGRHFLVMEFVEGLSLSHLLSQRGRIAPTIAADYIHQAALGLEHAHERGLIHRDIKPGNLLLSVVSNSSAKASDNKARTPGYGQIKILDLGLARFVQDQIAQPQVTREGIGMGTPDYMAPEQFRDAHVADARADIYSLGCTLFHLLTGRVPFPSSSLSEKFQAHAENEPPPLEELCPEAPAGLVLVVQRMMAKLPAERFQTAAEVADALAPYVAGSSPSLARLKATLSWKGGQLTSVHGRPRRRVLGWSIVSGVAVAVVVLAILGGKWFFSSDPSSPEPEHTGLLSASNEPSSLPARKSEGEPSKPQVVTIPNGLTVAKDGTGQFTTIREALDKAKPGMTIRVLDRGTYREALTLTSPSRHAGLVLEAVSGATLEVAEQFGIGVLIEAVPRVTLRGFRMRAEASRVVMVHVKTSAPGVLLEGLEMESGAGVDYDGIYLERLNHANDHPAVVQKCVLRRGKLGIAIHGMPASLLAVDGSKYPAPSRCSRIVVRENALVGFQTGILATGMASHVHIVGNRIWGGVRYAGIQFEYLAANSEELLVANNTLLESAPALRLWDTAPKGRGIMVRNNLVLGAALPDMLFIDSGGSPSQHKGPGDGKLIAKAWQMDHNWREVKEPQGQDIFSLSWIPPGEKDQRQDEIAVLSRDPDHADFLRPAKDSPLATAGAGGDLPTYVGAVPPEGVERWDWEKTWKAQTQKRSE